MSDPTVEEVLKLTDTAVEKSQKKPSVLGACFAFFLLPPWGVYLLWKEKLFHKTYASLSIIVGIFSLLTVFPLAVSLNSFFGWLSLLLTGIQLGYSIYCFIISGKKGFLQNSELIILTSLLAVVGVIILPILIYQQLSQLIAPYFHQEINIYNSIPSQ